MRILRVIASVDPATGGPVAGLRAVTPALASLGHDTEFLTVDEATEGYLQSFVGPVHALGPAKGSYSYSARVPKWLQKNGSRFDAIIIHGLWQSFGPMVRAYSRTPGAPAYFVFPHGMLDPHLRKAYPAKHIKKWLYWMAAERHVLRDARAVFFTCEEERRLAKTTFPLYQCNERVVAYGTAAPDGPPERLKAVWQKRFPELNGRPYFLFLGRIHSKKGVDVLLRAYTQLLRTEYVGRENDLPDLVLAGPCLDNGYLQELRTVARESVAAAKVHWTGMLTGDAKWGALQGAEAFILPSHQENFGIAVVEALACGTPVLLSDRVNIWREIVDAKAALVESASEEGASRLMARWKRMDEPSRAQMRTAARHCFEREFEVSRVARSLADELSSLIARPISSG